MFFSACCYKESCIDFKVTDIRMEGFDTEIDSIVIEVFEPNMNLEIKIDSFFVTTENKPQKNRCSKGCYKLRGYTVNGNTIQAKSQEIIIIK